MVEIQTRIKNKEGTYTEWADSDLVPLEGEIIIYKASDGNPQKIKIGNGHTRVTELPFLYEESMTKIMIHTWEEDD